MYLHQVVETTAPAIFHFHLLIIFSSILLLFSRCFFQMVTELATEGPCLHHTNSSKRDFFPKSSSQSSRVKSHWPGLDHVPIHEPMTAVREMEYSRWFPLDSLQDGLHWFLSPSLHCVPFSTQYGLDSFLINRIQQKQWDATLWD